MTPLASTLPDMSAPSLESRLVAITNPVTGEPDSEVQFWVDGVRVTATDYRAAVALFEAQTQAAATDADREMAASRSKFAETETVRGADRDAAIAELQAKLGLSDQAAELLRKVS